MKSGTSLSFTEIGRFGFVPLDAPSFVTSTDGIGLAYYPVRAKRPVAVLIFVHGGGAWSGAGYQYLAKGLCERHRVSVYLCDIRGHGKSDGPRGDAPSPTQVLGDLQTLIDAVGKENGEVPLYLGGHSSGAGLVLNYLTWKKDEAIRGYIFVSPQFGYRSGTDRKDVKNTFVRVNVPLFILHRVFRGRRFGNSRAVFFNYPEEVRRFQPLILGSITCNMAVALTPHDPRRQYAAIDRPFGLFIGRKDELFDPERVVGYAKLPEGRIWKRSRAEIIEGQNHLSILTMIDGPIGEAVGVMNGGYRPPKGG